MTAPDYSTFTQEQIDAERAAIAAERAALEAAKAPVQITETQVVTLPPEVIEDIKAEAADEAPAEAAEPEAEPWPHEHLVYMGLELDVRMPTQNALMGIAMLNQMDGNTQLELFNSFLGMHLSPASLTKVAREMMRPDTELTPQGLVQQLVYLRTGGSDED